MATLPESLFESADIMFLEFCGCAIFAGGMRQISAPIRSHALVRHGT
jgi:hypothetical protein